MRKLEQIVSDLLREEGGGEAYFDRLDALMREPENLCLVQGLFDFTGNVVASGRFGHYLRELRDRRLIRVRGNFVLVTGGLRGGAPAELLYQAQAPRRLFEHYTFIDDSYYSGKTERVTSLYRYYDHHGGE
jgi:type VI protein secretion system component VasF